MAARSNAPRPTQCCFCAEQEAHQNVNLVQRRAAPQWSLRRRTELHSQVAVAQQGTAKACQQAAACNVRCRLQLIVCIPHAERTPHVHLRSADMSDKQASHNRGERCAF